MGAEEESVEQAAETRRERLKALRAAKELLSTPDDNLARSAQSENGTVSKKFVETYEEQREIISDEQDLATQVAATRRDRLKDLRDAKELLNGTDKEPAEAESKGDSEDDEVEKLNVRFRNYVPHDKQLQEHKLAPPVLPKFEDPVATAPLPANVEDPFLNIAPKKPNWDLQRDVQKKLEKLERRTQKALYQLAQEQEKEKLALESNGDDVLMQDIEKV